MAHEHVWQKEPPDNRTSEDKYGDKRDMAHNSFWTSLEELQRLQLLVEKDPDFENSSDWPGLVEWCPSCGSTRVVKLVLPPTMKEEEMDALVKEEEIVADFEVDEVKPSCEATARDAGTQTPRRRRRGGRGCRMKRLLAFQLMLSQKKGLPLSRLLNTRLNEKSIGVKVEKGMKCTVKEEKEKEEREEEVCPKKEVSSSGPTHLTLRSFPTGANPPSAQTPPSSKLHSIGPNISPFSVPPPPIFTPPFMPSFQAPQYCQTPVANWGLCGGCHCWGPILPIWVVQ